MLGIGVGRRLGGSTQMGFSLAASWSGSAAGRCCWFVNEFEQLLVEAAGSNYEMPGGNEDVRDIPGDINF